MVELTKSLLDEGRIIVAENFYLPEEVVKAKLKRGEEIVRQRINSIQYWLYCTSLQFHITITKLSNGDILIYLESSIQ